jgi:hypothetical protein
LLSEIAARSPVYVSATSLLTSFLSDFAGSPQRDTQNPATELRKEIHVRCHAGALSRLTGCAHQAPKEVPKDVHEGIRTGFPGYCWANWQLERAWKAKISGMGNGRRLCRAISRLLVDRYPDKLLSLVAVGPVQGGNGWTRSAH